MGLKEEAFKEINFSFRQAEEQNVLRCMKEWKNAYYQLYEVKSYTLHELKSVYKELDIPMYNMVMYDFFKMLKYTISTLNQPNFAPFDSISTTLSLPKHLQ